MISALTQDEVSIFSSDAAGAKERPANGYYNSGVDVGYTAPAKWWNWLWNKITAFLNKGRADRGSILAELLHVLSAASVTPDAADSAQLLSAVQTLQYNATEAYDNETVTEEIGGVMVTHPKNRPYVVGHTVYYPDTELL